MAAVTQPYHTLRDLYPDVTQYLATDEQTVPETEEQSAYGEVRSGPAAARAYTLGDFWRLLGWIAILVILLLLFGAIR